MASTAITGTLRTTANDILDMHAGIWPVEVMLRWLCHRVVTRLATLPETHPLSRIFPRRAGRYIKTHRSPLHELRRLIQADVLGIKKLDMV